MSARYAVAWSGGKDSTLALDRARRAGLDVRDGLNLYNGENGRLQYHGVRHELVARQMRELGLTPLQLGTVGGDFETVFRAGLDMLRERGVTGMVFGNIHLGDVRAWYETRVSAVGFEHVEPLWHDTAEHLFAEQLARGYRARVVSIDTKLGSEAWLGREIDRAFANELLADPAHDPLGERGEYHTFVFDGPLFRAPILHSVGARLEMFGHMLVDVEPVEAPGSAAGAKPE